MKKRIAALAFAAMLTIGLAGCGLVSVDPAKDYAQIVAKIGEEELTKGELYDELNAQFVQEGYAIDVYSSDIDEETREIINNDILPAFLDQEVEYRLVKQIADRDYALTEEEIAQADQSLKEYEDFIKIYMLQYDENNPDAYEGDIEQDVSDYFVTTVGMTTEEYREKVLMYTKFNKVYEDITGDITADEDQLKEQYDESLKEQKEAAESGTSEYEAAVTNSTLGDYVVYKPAGYRMVKQVLIGFTEEDQEKIDEVDQEISTLTTEQETAQTALTEAEEAMETAEADGDTSEKNKQKKIVDEQQKIVDDTTAQIEKLEERAAALRDAAAKNIMTQAQEVTARAKAGENFDDLVKEYNTDPGMEEPSFAASGYLVSEDSTTYDATFLEAANQLSERGEVSDPIQTEYGLHILYLAYELDEEVEIPYESVKDVVAIKADSAAQEDVWVEQVEKWSKEIGVKKYKSRLKYNAPSETDSASATATPSAE